MNKKTFVVLACATGLCFAGPAQASIDFVFNFTDAPGFGFNANGQVGADRRAGLNQAADIVEALFVNYNASINMDVNGSQTQDQTLASASSNFNAPGTTDFNNAGDVQRKILGLADPAPGVADGLVDWNFEDFTWEPLSDFQPGELDLISTAAHELLHAVGFASDIAQNGSDAFGNPAGTPGMWSPFDQFVADSSGSLIDVSLTLNGTRWNTASEGGTGTAPATSGLYFNGASAMAANGGNPVPLFSPTTWLGGSSGSHWDTDFFTGSNALMMNHEAAVPDGLDIRTVDSITVGLLRDIGYGSIVPEPSTFALAILALGCLYRRMRAA